MVDGFWSLVTISHEKFILIKFFKDYITKEAGKLFIAINDVACQNCRSLNSDIKVIQKIIHEKW